MRCPLRSPAPKHSAPLVAASLGLSLLFATACTGAVTDAPNQPLVDGGNAAPDPDASVVATCGNGTCAGSETCTSCEADCGECPVQLEGCGDDTCAVGEDCASCQADCGACPPPPPPSCGNDTCGDDETCSSCEEDCGECPEPETCGDDTCNAGETCATCEADCNACPPPPPSCGDSACNGGETCASCATDCGACPPAAPVVGHTLAELLAIKAKIKAGQDPWKGHWDLIVAGGGAYRAGNVGGHASHTNAQRAFASPDYVPAPIDMMSLETKPFPAGYGKYDAVRNFRDDGTAAFTLALRYVFEDSNASADAAVEILDAWSSTLTYINPWDDPLGGNLNQHGLEASFGIGHYTRAIALLWNYPGFQAIKPQVQQWLLDVFMASPTGPLYVEGRPQTGTLLASNGAGNGGFSSLWGRLGIGLIVGGTTGDTIVQNAITRFKQVLRSHIYWTGDHHTLLGAPWPYESERNVHLDQKLGQAGFWYFGSVALAEGPPLGFFNGLTQEAGRDFGHNQMSMGPWSYFLRTAQLNGHDLWDDTAGIPGGIERIKAAVSNMAGWYNETLDRVWATSDPGDGFGTFGGDMAAIEASAWTPTGVGYGTVNFAEHNISSTNRSAWSGPPSESIAPSNLNIGGGSADMGWFLLHQELVVRRGISMPQLDRLVKRLRNPGGARTKDNQAGFGRISGGNAMYWEPLLFTEP